MLAIYLYITNNNGPKIDPCGILRYIFKLELFLFSGGNTFIVYISKIY